MRKSLLFCLAVAASLALAGPVLAQGDQASTSSTSSAQSTTVTGTVVSSSDSQLVVDTPTGRQTFTVASGTSNVPTGLSAGTQVTVEFTTSGDQRTVTNVTTGTSSSPSTSPYSSSSSSSSSSTSPSTSSTSPYSSSSSSPSSTAPRSSTSGTDNDMNRTGRHHRRAGTSTDDDHDAANNNLPATASPAFLMGLLGLLSLGGSALLRALRRLF